MLILPSFTRRNDKSSVLAQPLCAYVKHFEQCIEAQNTAKWAQIIGKIVQLFLFLFSHKCLQDWEMETPPAQACSMTGM